MAAALFCPSPVRPAASAGPPPVREWKPLARVIFGKCRVYRKRASVGVQCQRRRPIGRRAETEPLCCGRIDESVKSSREGNTLLPSFLFISFTFSKRMRIFILHRNDPKSVIALVVFFVFFRVPMSFGEEGLIYLMQESISFCLLEIFLIIMKNKKRASRR